MEYMKLSDFLGSVWEARFQYRRCVSRVEELQQRCTQVVTSWDCTPRGGGNSRRDGPLAALADQRALLPELYRAWEGKEEEVERFLDKIEDRRFRAILKLRYVDLFQWPRVVEELEKSGLYYSERQVFNLHRKALEQAEDLWQMEQQKEISA